MDRRSRSITLISFLGILFAISAAAAPPTPPVSIDSTSANTISNELTIAGNNFGTSAPTVVLDG